MFPPNNRYRFGSNGSLEAGDPYGMSQQPGGINAGITAGEGTMFTGIDSAPPTTAANQGAMGSPQRMDERAPAMGGFNSGAPASSASSPISLLGTGTQQQQQPMQNAWGAANQQWQAQQGGMGQGGYGQPQRQSDPYGMRQQQGGMGGGAFGPSGGNGQSGMFQAAGQNSAAAASHQQPQGGAFGQPQRQQGAFGAPQRGQAQPQRQPMGMGQQQRQPQQNRGF